MRKINKTKTTDLSKNSKEAEAPKNKKHEHKTERIPKMLAQETSWTERRLCTKHQNNDMTTNKKRQQRVPYSLKTYSKYIKHKTCSVNKKNPRKKK